MLIHAAHMLRIDAVVSDIRFSYPCLRQPGFLPITCNCTSTNSACPANTTDNARPSYCTLINFQSSGVPERTHTQATTSFSSIGSHAESLAAAGIAQTFWPVTHAPDVGGAVSYTGDTT